MDAVLTPSHPNIQNHLKSTRKKKKKFCIKKMTI